ncbi:MAG: sensor domain-containing protein [Anaerolineaceae bacterium]|nr:sensor domain-containing protein [Anaerolineaceae bacterium]
MNEKSFWGKFYGVFAKSATYLNLVYLYLTFPLGIVYFVFLVTGWALGISLTIIWIGLLVLALVFAISWGLTAFERWLATGMLRVDIPPMQRAIDPSASVWQRLKTYFANPVTWKGMLYLLIKFPLGILNFTVATTVLAISFSLLVAPLALVIPGWHVYTGDWNIYLDLFARQVVIAQPDPYMIAGLVFLAGIFAAPASLHLLNWMAKWQGKLAQAMFGQKELAAGDAGEIVAPVPEAVPAAQPEDVAEELADEEPLEN